MAVEYCISGYLRFRLMIKRYLSVRGVTLIELMMVLMFMAIAVLVMGKYLGDLHESYTLSKAMMEVQEQAQYALDRIVYGFVTRSDDPQRETLIWKGGLLWAFEYDISEGNERSISFCNEPLNDPNRVVFVYEGRENMIVKYREGYPDRAETIIPYNRTVQDDGAVQGKRLNPFDAFVRYRTDPADPDRSVSIKVTVRYWRNPDDPNRPLLNDPNQQYHTKRFLGPDILTSCMETTITPRNCR
ncbi:MAG: hypothetical protein AB1847_17935 [bacterium]